MSGKQLNNKYEEVTISTKPIFEGRIISLQVDEVRLPNGETSTREIVKHPGAVTVMALLDGKLLVVEQYRKPLEKSQVELPAGKLEKGEEPLEAVRRELEEETGYKAGTLRHITSFYSAPGFTNELVHLYLAEDLQKGEMKLDEDEFLDCEAITLEQAEAYMAEGRISDAKTIMAVYLWKLYKMTGNI